MIEFDGGATEGLVRKTTIAEGPLSEVERGDVPETTVRSALEDGDLLVTIHTDQHPRGEIAGVVEPVDGHGSDADGNGRDKDEPLEEKGLVLVEFEWLNAGEPNVERAVLSNTGDEPSTSAAGLSIRSRRRTTSSLRERSSIPTRRSR